MANSIVSHSAPLLKIGTSRFIIIMDWNDFVAQDELIEIVPNFRYAKQIHLISGDFGPFQPSVPCKVPLWLAMNLHNQSKCSVLLPQWCNELVEFQRRQMDSTAQADEKLQKVPHEFWREILNMIKSMVAIPNCNDVIAKREAIMRHSLHSLFKHVHENDRLIPIHITLDNCSRGELAFFKQLIQLNFNHLEKLRAIKAVAAPKDDEDSQM